MTSLFTDIFCLLAIAVGLVWLFKRVHLPPVLAYLTAGVLAGPFGSELITDFDQFHFVAELGVVFLLFTLGLEFSVPKLMAMRQIVFALGSLQVCITLLSMMALLLLTGLQLLNAFAIAGLMALSSTAVVIKQLSESGLLHSRKGQLAVGVLLFQDLAVVPLLIAIPILAGQADHSIAVVMTVALLKGFFVCGLLWGIGKWILPWVFTEVASTRTDELFVLTTLLVTLFASGLTYFFGLSMALGAFLAGMMLGESQYRHQLESDIRPFRDILMGLFFTTIGMQLDLGYVLYHFLGILVCLAVLILVKLSILYGLARLLGERKSESGAVALMLCQMGEFSFVLISLSLKHQVLAQQQASLLIAIGVLSMAATPYLIEHHKRILRLFVKHDLAEPDNARAERPDAYQDHVVICGFGRVGQTVARFLKAEGIAYVVFDLDPYRVREAQVAGERVYFGDAKQSAILKAASVAESKLVIITFAEFNKASAVVSGVKRLNQKTKILVRTKDDKHLSQLEKLGVSDVIPESLETSLMLVSHVLHLSGVPVKRILRQVQKERRNRYGSLHGYFPGEETKISSYSIDQLEYLHAVAITDNAFAVGKLVTELNWQRYGVELMEVRRSDSQLDKPACDIKVIEQDIIVVRGKPKNVERFERYLLEGD